MTGELWWNRMINAVRFLDDAQEALESGRSVVLHFPDRIPWQDILTDELRMRLACMTDSRTFDCYDGTDIHQPGEFLFKRYCSEAERKLYWPTKHKTHERFMAGSRNTPLNHRYVCITGIHSGNAGTWVRSVSEYLEYCDTEQEHGSFILIIQGTDVRIPAQLDSFRYGDYITDYDCMMLCLTLLSSVSCSRMQKLYLSEAASNIADNNVELAGLLVSAELELARDPIGVTKELFAGQGIKMTKLEEKVNMAVWEAQVRLVFPKLEYFRRTFVQKYQPRLQRCLPVTSSNGERVESASDLEIGQLYYICKANKLLEYQEQEFELLRKMRDARNLLAHWQSLSYQELLELGIL